MAVSLDALLGTAKGHNVAAVITTTNAVAAGGRVVVVAGRFDSGAGTLSIAGGGLTWATDHNLSSGSLRIYVFSAPAPAGLAASSTLTVSSSSPGTTDIQCGALSLLGVDTSVWVAGFNGAAASTAGWSSGSVSAGSGDTLVGGAFEDGSGTLTSTPTGPALEAWDFNDATQTEACTGVYTTGLAGSAAAAGTWSGAISHIAIGVAYKAAAAGGATSLLVPPFRRAHSGLYIPMR